MFDHNNIKDWMKKCSFDPFLVKLQYDQDMSPMMKFIDEYLTKDRIDEIK